MSAEAVPIRSTKKGKSSSFTEKDYMAIAKQNVVRAADVPIYPKILIYARKKQGKTTLALTAAPPSQILVIDPEEGAIYKRKTNPYVWRVNTWEDLQDVYGALRTGRLSPDSLGLGPEKAPFKWVIPDGLTRFNNFALHYVRRESEERDIARHPGFIDRRDYNKSGELMKQLMHNLHTLKMGVIYTAQERMKTLGSFDEDEEDAENPEVLFVPDLPDSVRGTVNSLVDVIGRLYTVRIDGKEGKKQVVRRLYVGVHDKYDTGFRSEFALPEVVRNPTIPKLVKLMEGDQS